MKIVPKIQLKVVIFTAVKNSCMLHGHVFVMVCLETQKNAVLRKNIWYFEIDSNKQVQCKLHGPALYKLYIVFSHE